MKCIIFKVNKAEELLLTSKTKVLGWLICYETIFLFVLVI